MTVASGYSIKTKKVNVGYILYRNEIKYSTEVRLKMSSAKLQHFIQATWINADERCSFLCNPYAWDPFLTSKMINFCF